MSTKAISDVFGNEWGAVNQIEARRIARDPEVKPLRIRLLFAAMGWANQIGHAEFPPQGLANVLLSASATTGEISIPSSSQLGNAIRGAVTDGLLAEGSGIRCLVLPAELWHRAGGKGNFRCAWHGLKVPR